MRERMKRGGVLQRDCRRWIALAVLAFSIAIGEIARGEVVRLDIKTREPFAGGHVFGRSGAYERVIGRVYYEVDVNESANARVWDLKLAPRTPDGKVAFWSDFFLLTPSDPTRGNRRLLYDVNNRGNKLLLGAFNNAGGNDPKTLADAGNGFLMRQGFSVLWCGWNGDVKPGNDRLLIGLPVARENGRTITGKVYAEICVNERVYSQPFYWGNSDPYPSVSLDTSTASLTMRPERSAAPIKVPDDQWAFARWENGTAVPDPKHLYLKDGYRPGWLYDLVYEAKDPRVTGLGFVAVRDLVSFLRHAAADRTGWANPLGGILERAYAFGISQSGRFIHHMVYEGFNTDELGRIVFDGVMPHVGGGGRGFFNGRFVQTTRHGSQHEGNLYPSDQFPFTSVEQTDPVTGRRGEILARARQSGHIPKIIFTETSTEYWARAGSLLHTDVQGTRDVGPDERHVRLYTFAGAQHGVSGSMARGIYQHPRNVLDHRPLLRAVLLLLDRWVTTGVAPPPSVFPRIADRTLVDLATYRKSFPKIPDVSAPQVVYTPVRLDLGPRWASEGIIDHVPPKVGPAYRTLVPAIDANGNEIAGLRLPEVAVPIAAYTGWNTRAARYGAEGALARWSGATLLFATTRQERQQRGDPRRSVRERYATRQIYLARMTEAALSLHKRGFLLEEDVVAILEKAGDQRFWND